MKVLVLSLFIVVTGFVYGGITNHNTDYYKPSVFFFTTDMGVETPLSEYRNGPAFIAFYLPNKNEDGAVPLYRYINHENNKFVLGIEGSPLPPNYSPNIDVVHMGYVFAKGGTDRVPVYDFVKKSIDEHYYSTDRNEIEPGFKRVGVAFYAQESESSITIKRYRFIPFTKETNPYRGNLPSCYPKLCNKEGVYY